MPTTRGSTDSILLADLAPGNFTLEVSDEAGAVGDFVVRASLAGDFDGDRDVDLADLTAIRNLQGSRSYDVNADVDRDGRVTSSDYTLARRNYHDRTSLEILNLTVALDPAPDQTLPDGSLLATDSSLTLTGSTAPGARTEIDFDGDGQIDLGVTTGNGQFAATGQLDRDSTD